MIGNRFSRTPTSYNASFPHMATDAKICLTYFLIFLKNARCTEIAKLNHEVVRHRYGKVN